MATGKLTAYWAGYGVAENPADQPLDKTPSFADEVPMAFAGPATDCGSLDVSYLCSRYSPETVKPWIKALQARGQRVLISLMDTPSTHWNVVDKRAFAKDVAARAIGEWGLDGVDIDAESGMPQAGFVVSFVELIQEMRRAIGSDKLISYTCYTGCSPGDNDYEILTRVKEDVDWVNTMAYFYGLEQMRAQFREYAAVVGNENVSIGVKAGKPGTGDQSTSLDQVIEITKWQPHGNPKRGVMFWSVFRDAQPVTGRPDWTYMESIRKSL